MLARDWVLVAKNCKHQRKLYRANEKTITGYGGTSSFAETSVGVPFMSFPATLDQRIQSRFGPKWAQDKKIKKKIWDMYPEFRLRDRF